MSFVLLVLLVVVYVNCLAALIRDLRRSPHSESDMRSTVGVTGVCRISEMLVSDRRDLGRACVLD